MTERSEAAVPPAGWLTTLRLQEPNCTRGAVSSESGARLCVWADHQLVFDLNYVTDSGLEANLQWQKKAKGFLWLLSPEIWSSSFKRWLLSDTKQLRFTHADRNLPDAEHQTLSAGNNRHATQTVIQMKGCFLLKDTQLYLPLQFPLGWSSLPVILYLLHPFTGPVSGRRPPSLSCVRLTLVTGGCQPRHDSHTGTDMLHEPCSRAIRWTPSTRSNGDYKCETWKASKTGSTGRFVLSGQRLYPFPTFHPCSVKHTKCKCPEDKPCCT